MIVKVLLRMREQGHRATALSRLRARGGKLYFFGLGGRALVHRTFVQLKC